MQWYADLRKNETGIWWAIYDQKGQTFYGAGGFNDWDKKNQKAEIGFWLLPKYWGQGIMQEVMPALFQIGFTQMNLNRIEGFVDANNKNVTKDFPKLISLMKALCVNAK